jgi:hypothetical protein
MLAAFFLASVLSSQFITTNENVEELILHSYEVPVFLFVYNSHCWHCQRVHPTWLQLMANFSDHPNIIIAEVDVVMYHSAVHRIIHPHRFPEFTDLIRGKATQINIHRQFNDFFEHAQLLIANSSLAGCTAYVPGSNSFPVFVLSVPSASCKVLNQVCHLADIPLKKCLMGDSYGSQFRVRIFYGTAHGIDLNSSDMNTTVALLRDFSREQLGSWDVREARDSTRRLVIVLYSSWAQVHMMRKVDGAVVSEFAFGRMSLAELRSRQPSIQIELNQTPALLVADQQQSKFALCRSFTPSQPFANQIQQNDTHVIVGWDDLFRDQAQWQRPWLTIFGLIAVFLLAVLHLTSRIEGSLETRLSCGGEDHNIGDVVRCE